MHDQLPDHLLRVYRFAMHLCGDQHLAEDLAQEAMLRAVRSAGKLNEPQAIKVWLLQVVTNLWRDWCRAKGRRPTKSLPDEDVVGEQLEPLERLSQAEEVTLTVEAMHSLPERQRSVLVLVACEELTISEVSEVLQITPEAVRSSLSLARARMRKILQSNEQPKTCEYRTRNSE